MGLQILWSFGLACLDLHALRMKKSLRNSVLLCLFAIGDWVSISVLELAKYMNMLELYMKIYGQCTIISEEQVTR